MRLRLCVLRTVRGSLFLFVDKHHRKADSQQHTGGPDGPGGQPTGQQRTQPRAHGEQPDDAELGQGIAQSLRSWVWK